MKKRAVINNIYLDIEKDEEPYCDWLHPHQLRIVVPKATLQQHRDLLIFKSYAEVMGLPFEVLEDVVHFYCNEILEQDQAIIAALNLTVETK